jgi:enoyl-CoA hydratase
MSGDVLLVERRGDVVVLRLNRPERRNALSQELIDAIEREAVRLRDDDSVVAVVITGSAGSFCAGLDLVELGAGRIRLEGDFVGAVRALPQATIAAIDGPAAAGGLELALACDIRLGSGLARFADTHARVGVVPGGGASVLLERVVGLGRALEMSLSARMVEAAEAERWGLLNSVVEGDVVDAALALAERIAGNQRATVRQIKSMVLAAADRGLGDALEHEREEAARFVQTFDPEDVAAVRADVIARNRAGH